MCFGNLLNTFTLVALPFNLERCLVFRENVLISLIYNNHCGYTLGVMNAADYYGLDELRRSCVGFVQCCINVDTVCALLASAELYIQYKCTKSLVQKVFAQKIK